MFPLPNLGFCPNRLDTIFLQYCSSGRAIHSLLDGNTDVIHRNLVMLKPSKCFFTMLNKDMRISISISIQRKRTVHPIFAVVWLCGFD